MAQNPFISHEDTPETPDPAEMREVMDNIFLKGFMMNILELFLGVFGIAATSSISNEDQLKDLNP